MTTNEFAILCEKYGIHPSVALENENLVELLKAKQYNKIEEFIKNNF